MAALALAFQGCGKPAPPTTAARPAEPGPARVAPAPDLGAPQPSSSVIPVSSRDPVWGSPSAPVTLVMFTDFECPYCASAHGTLRELQRKYGPDQLRVVIKHNPLPMHPGALPAARAAQAVFELAGAETFFAYADLLYRGQRSLYDSTLTQLAREVGLTSDTFTPRFLGGDVALKVSEDAALAQSLGEGGTPAFRINGARVVGAQPYAEFAKVIDAELEQARALAAAGTPATGIYAARVTENLKADPPRPQGAPDAPPPEVYRAVPIGDSPSRGPKDALVTIVEFSEYQCPYCKRAEPTVGDLLQRYPKDLRVVFKHNPLPFHEYALPAARFAVEARKQRGDAGFWQASARLFEQSPKLSDDDLLALASALKLNVDQTRRALSEQRHTPEIEADQALAAQVGASGTPTFYINGRELVGAQPLEAFTEIVDEELVKARALLEAGTPRSRVYAAILEKIAGSAP